MILFRISVLQAVAMHAFISYLSSTTSRKTSAARFVVRAFVTTSNQQIPNPASRHAVTTTTTTTTTAGAPLLFARSSHHTFVPVSSSSSSSSSPSAVVIRSFSTSSTALESSASATAAAVEEDLDAALDDILGETAEVDGVAHIEGSKPMPHELVDKEDPVNYHDPAFLSTSNPRWVQAGLDPKVIDVLSNKGITHFTPVQAEAFDPILAGRDVIGRSRTGTGKTLAFGLPSMTRLIKLMEENGKRDPKTGRMSRGRMVSMIILCPTRELARQVSEELAAAARPLGLFVDVFHGGVSYEPQARALRDGVDILVGTPGRVIDHIERGNLKLSECEIVVLDEADEMLNMGFAEDVEVILEGVGSDNERKTQCLLFSATTPPWVKEIGRSYQEDVLAIDSTGEEGGARVAKTVRHLAVQVPPGIDSKRSLLEDIIAVEISKDADEDSDDEDLSHNPLAAAAKQKKRKSSHAMQQKIFGKTIVFTETKREADELVSGGVFKSLTAQALHGDVGQKQRDATLNAFRAGSFNVLVATDVAARGIDISDVDLVVQFDPPRDVDTYVHRSGRTGRAGKKGVSVLLFNHPQARDIVRIERDLGHGFKFDLVGPPSTEAALSAAAKTSAIASKGIPEDTAHHFKESAAQLLAEADDPVKVVARCLAAISRRSTEVQSRSLITGEAGMATVQMVNSRGRNVAPNDVMFTVGKLSRMSRSDGDLSFDSDIGKILANRDAGSAMFDMSLEDAKKLVEFSKDIDAGGAEFTILKELEIERDHNFGKQSDRRRGRFDDRNGRGSDRRGGRFNDRNNNRFANDRDPRSRGYRNQNNYNDRSNGKKYGGHRNDGRRNDGNRGGGFRGRYDNRRQQNDQW